MNPLDDQLDCLLRAASLAARSDGTVSAAPFGLETRVLAAWRGAGAPGMFGQTALLLRGLLLASLIMLLCLWPALHHGSGAGQGPDAESLQLADSTLQVDKW